MTTTLNTSDDTVGSASAVVYFIVTNATVYNNRENCDVRPTQIAPGEEFGLTAEQHSSAIIQGQTNALKRNPTSQPGIHKNERLTALSAESGDVS
jgi:hypothetical protein